MRDAFSVAMTCCCRCGNTGTWGIGGAGPKLSELGAEFEVELLSTVVRDPGAAAICPKVPFDDNEEGGVLVLVVVEEVTEPGGDEIEFDEEDGDRGNVGDKGPGDPAPGVLDVVMTVIGKGKRVLSRTPDFFKRLPLRAVTTTGAAGSGAGTAGASEAAFLPLATCVTSHIAKARTFSSFPRKIGTVS